MSHLVQKNTGEQTAVTSSLELINVPLLFAPLIWIPVCIAYSFLAGWLRRNKILEWISGGNETGGDSATLDALHLLTLINATISALGLMCWFSWYLIGFLALLRHITIGYFIWDSVHAIAVQQANPWNEKKMYVAYITLLHHLGTALYISNIGFRHSSAILLISYYIADLATFAVFRAWLSITRKEVDSEILFWKKLEAVCYFVLRVVVLAGGFLVGAMSSNFFTPYPSIGWCLLAYYLCIYSLNLGWFWRILSTIN